MVPWSSSGTLASSTTLVSSRACSILSPDLQCARVV